MSKDRFAHCMFPVNDAPVRWDIREMDVLDLTPDDHSFTPVVTAAEEAFADAKASLGSMLPRLLVALNSKFRDQFYMRATQQRFRLYYYFSGDPALETIALTMTLDGGRTSLWLGYIPNSVAMSGADFKRAIQEQASVDDPEMTGLALMRLSRSLLAKIW